MIFDLSDLPRRDALTIVVLDVETTGLPRINNADPRMTRAFDGCRLLSLAAMKWHVPAPGARARVVDALHRIVLPEDHVVPPCPVHDITHALAVAEGVPLLNVVKSLCTMVEGADCIVAYNTPFDYSVITSELHRYGWKQYLRQLDAVPWACAMRMAIAHLGVERWPKLAAAYAAMHPASGALAAVQLHDALNDTAVASQVFMRALGIEGDGAIVVAGPEQVTTRARCWQATSRALSGGGPQNPGCVGSV